MIVLPEEPEKKSPCLQSGKVIQETRFSGFGLSVQGLSHVRKETPCQDSNDLRYLPGADLILAAVSDGVGSCPLSQWGSNLAVQTALDYLEEKLRNASQGKRMELTEDQWIYECLINSFRAAQNAVDEMAEANSQNKWDFQATLTVILYDGSTLWCCHAGDDGVVIQFQDGFVKMLTQRLKGEEASSVYPLQSGEGYWRVNKVASQAHGSVVGVVMATDGVLDAFVMDHPRYLEVSGCCNGVFYPFIHDAIYDDNTKKPGPCNPHQRLTEYSALLNGESYRNRVTDDLTFVSILCNAGICKSVVPAFDMEAWNQTAVSIQEERLSSLYQTSQNNPEPKDKKPVSGFDEQTKSEEISNISPEMPRNTMQPPRKAPSLTGNMAKKTIPPRTGTYTANPHRQSINEYNQQDSHHQIQSVIANLLRKVDKKKLITIGAMVGLVLIGILIGLMLSRPKPVPKEPESTAKTQEVTESVPESGTISSFGSRNIFEQGKNAESDSQAPSEEADSEMTEPENAEAEDTKPEDTKPDSSEENTVSEV